VYFLSNFDLTEKLKSHPKYIILEHYKSIDHCDYDNLMIHSFVLFAKKCVYHFGFHKDIDISELWFELVGPRKVLRNWRSNQALQIVR